MTYQEALEFIHGVNWTFCKPGLERISELCKKLGNPERDLKFIHVGGTNGKGSFCAMLSSVLKKSGYKCGFYTSPYILRFNERIQINGEPISDCELVSLCERLIPIVKEMKEAPTEFELITALAFLYFKEKGVDLVVLEVGMGGRLDATNIISEPILSVITGISLDHTAYLGDTVEKIAFEKAGIIKKCRPVLFCGCDKSAEAVIASVAKENESPFFTVDYSKLTIRESELSGTAFDFSGYENFKINLLGLYQPRNASAVLCAIDILRKAGLEISENDTRGGLYDAKWPARFEVISKKPLVIFDGAHNPEGIIASVESIKKYFMDSVHILTGVLRDKDYTFIAKTLSEVASKATTITPDNPRALSAHEYAEILSSFGVSAEPKESVSDALSSAIAKAEKEEAPLICLGSLYTYGEVISALSELGFSNKLELEA